MKFRVCANSPKRNKQFVKISETLSIFNRGFYILAVCLMACHQVREVPLDPAIRDATEVCNKMISAAGTDNEIKALCEGSFAPRRFSKPCQISKFDYRITLFKAKCIGKGWYGDLGSFIKDLNARQKYIDDIQYTSYRAAAFCGNQEAVNWLSANGKPVPKFEPENRPECTGRNYETSDPVYDFLWGLPLSIFYFP